MTGEEFSARDNETSFEPLSAESITSEKANIKYLLLMQVDRINYLLTFKLSNCQLPFQFRATLIAIAAGLRSLESMLSTVVSQEYRDKVEWIVNGMGQKTTIKKIAPYEEIEVSLIDQDHDAYLNFCLQWYDLLVGEMGRMNLLPAKRKEFEFDKGLSVEEEDEDE